ncbi:nucleotidyl transferase AbiEii/AbiGii toxin family protein [Nocardioides caeni]|uniref:Nucleotidyl transferase AbiEii/AbiGii toxin family protein n=1 Tax=Nocardioides caeni TaxID=574700 RepID=A0A4S8NHB3_9ACTN|nr:nucleotidyl transferase AbiEii/AbiGii toxin family protein [Nocardioides caeni]THV16147.1 nucleotidyl transferase AbiEii/AbiGii toxin family protein [Nocardioides caeni]
MIPEDPLVVPRRCVALVLGWEDVGIRATVGGALALGYHVHEPRATRDIDLNVALDKSAALPALRTLPEGPQWDEEDLAAIERDGQVRLWWPVPGQQRMPLDLFFAEHQFHRVATDRALWVPMLDAEVPILSATDLTVFKALFDRPKDWVDIGEMVSYGPPSLDLENAAHWVSAIVGDSDVRVARLRDLAEHPPEPPAQFTWRDLPSQ